MQKRGQWASNLGFIMAAAGSAVGLGNIWKFPGKVGAYGGGTFILCYIAIVILIGFPVMLAELSIGRSTQKNVVGAFHALNKKWTFAGGIGVITLFVIMSYYCIVGGWVMKYIGVYLMGADFGAGKSAYQTYFVDFITKPIEPLVWGLCFLVLCIYVVIRGVSEGIEKVSKVLMPVLFLLLIACVVRACTLSGAEEGIRFMLTVNLDELNGSTLVGALGQAFFSLSVGMGIMVTYGSYVPKSDNLAKSAGYICILDTFVAILAAFAIIPVVFATVGAEGLGMGGGFAFMALPEIFAQITGGRFVGLAFFLLLLLAALTSAISILESCVAFLTEEYRWSRAKAVLIFSIPMAFFSAGYSLSQADTRGISLPWFDFANGVQMLPMNAVMEKFTDNLMIPVGALLFCIFVGWIWGADKASKEITSNGTYKFPIQNLWKGIIRFVAPIVICIILYMTVGNGIVLS